MPHPTQRQVENAELTSVEGRVLGSILTGIGDELHRLGNAMQVVTNNLGRMGMVEERQKDTALALERCFIELRRCDDNQTQRREAVEGRVAVIERDMPGMRELRKWVIGGVVAGVAMIAGSLLKLVIIDPVALKPQIVYVQPPADKKD